MCALRIVGVQPTVDLFYEWITAFDHEINDGLRPDQIETMPRRAKSSRFMTSRYRVKVGEDDIKNERGNERRVVSRRRNHFRQIRV
jgi:hypothetical protein